MIFTSPSNAEAYFSDINTVIESYQHIVAIGKSTASKLNEFGYNDVIIPRTPDEIGLSEAIYSIL
jgi:hydroxymethylbilane synthase